MPTIIFDPDGDHTFILQEQKAVLQEHEMMSEGAAEPVTTFDTVQYEHILDLM